MDRRDWTIIFCLLLPFFITLPLYLTTRYELGQQSELLLRTQDSLHSVRFRFERRLAADRGEVPASVPAEPVTLTTADRTPPPAPETTPEVQPAPAPRPATVETPAPAVTTPPVASQAPRPAPPAQTKPITPEPTPAERTDTVYVSRGRQLATPAKLAERIAPSQSENGLVVGNYSMKVSDDRATGQQALTVGCRLRQVPEELRGSRKFYLVITDQATGEVVSGLDNIRGTINYEGMQLPIYAAARRSLTLGQQQQVTFQRTLPRPLPAGNYVVEVYSDLGQFGGAHFQLGEPQPVVTMTK